jgi:hypothetical protein
VIHKATCSQFFVDTIPGTKLFSLALYTNGISMPEAWSSNKFKPRESVGFEVLTVVGYEEYHLLGYNTV